ncbi:hypothetical protein AB9F35_36965, partial [Rhizobium leguminosarum]
RRERDRRSSGRGSAPAYCCLGSPRQGLRAPKKETSKESDDKPKKSLLKQPAFLAGMGVAYLAIVGIIGYVILSDSDS